MKMNQDYTRVIQKKELSLYVVIYIDLTLFNHRFPNFLYYS